jgi:hypothetical protein
MDRVKTFWHRLPIPESPTNYLEIVKMLRRNKYHIINYNGLNFSHFKNTTFDI